MHVVRIGLALAALPAMVAIESRVRPARAWQATLVAGALASCVWWQLPLRERIPSPASVDIKNVDVLWQWLNEHPVHGGRVVLQDTFDAGAPDPLAWSHVLARTPTRTGSAIVGAWYGGVPFPTFAWTQSEFGGLLGVAGSRLGDRALMNRVVDRMHDANAPLLVVSNPDAARLVARDDDLTLVRRVGRFTVFEVRRLAPSWVTPLSGDGSVTMRPCDSGRIRFETEAEKAGSSVVVHVAWHRFWKLRGAPGARVERDSGGLIEIKNLPAGRTICDLTWTPPRSPYIISAIAFVLIVAIAPGFRRRNADDA